MPKKTSSAPQEEKTLAELVKEANERSDNERNPKYMTPAQFKRHQKEEKQFEESKKRGSYIT